MKTNFYKSLKFLKCVASIFALFSLLTLQPAFAARVLMDSIAATVNDQAITDQTLDTRVSVVKQQLLQKGTKIPNDETLRRQVLDRLIDESLQLQLANRMGVTVDNSSLDDAIANIAKQNNLTLQQFHEALAKDGYDYGNFRRDLQNEMLMQRVQQRVLAPDIVITEKEIDQLVERMQRSETQDDQYRLNHILIALPENPTPEDVSRAEAKIKKIQNGLASGKQFSELSVSYSEGQQALQGGDLGWRKLGELPALFADKVKTMTTRSIAGPLRNASGFHFIQLAEKRSTKTTEEPVAQTKVSHIMLRNTDLEPAEATKKRLETIRARALKGESFAELAKVYSDDRTSADHGGDLGWITAGKIDPKFENVMDQTNIGEVSPVFANAIGWQILKVTDRKQASVSNALRREQANAQLFQRKMQEALVGWISQLRDQAHVVINKM